jgi:hypothetical protein
MNDNEIDMYEFAKMFDAAIASDNPAVKKALRNFMLIAAISESTNTVPGLFQSMIDRLAKLENDVAGLRNNQPGYYGNNPTWVSGTGIGSIGYPSYTTVTSGGGSAGGSSINTSSIRATNSSTISEQDIVDLMSELKSDSYWNATDVSSIEQAYKDANGK